mmetsp:Transcript_101443/g.286167  ORF Transcript_101443/g.286167 Transcript_101443/m.286167 type:complete len:301 (-) Transcript_101443:174-1076(-)
MQEFVLFRRLHHIHAAAPQMAHQAIRAAMRRICSQCCRARAAVGRDENARAPDACSAVDQHWRRFARGRRCQEAVQQAREGKEPLQWRRALVPPPRHRELRATPCEPAPLATQRPHDAVCGCVIILGQHDERRRVLAALLVRRLPILREVRVLSRVHSGGVQHHNGSRTAEGDHLPKVHDCRRQRMLRHDIRHLRRRKARHDSCVDVRDAHGFQVNLVASQCAVVCCGSVEAVVALLRGPIGRRRRPSVFEVLMQNGPQLNLKSERLRGGVEVRGQRPREGGQLREGNQILTTRAAPAHL